MQGKKEYNGKPCSDLDAAAYSSTGSTCQHPY